MFKSIVNKLKGRGAVQPSEKASCCNVVIKEVQESSSSSEEKNSRK
ncbi:MAG: hypothetical protein LRY73_12380 [Bacillus sp. (in: Bacteria)]|nr:hypothetical protein [Bacillus sp. (in: firmicutes)]